VGEQKHTGKVEIQYQETWGLVCSGGWDIRDAHVICRMLGYKAAERAISPIEGETTRRLLMYYVKCGGKEKSIAECYHYGWWKTDSYGYYCTNEYLAGVICQVNEGKMGKLCVQ
jgi:deleted-in-malignant-brain-tumors protein 1